MNDSPAMEIKLREDGENIELIPITTVDIRMVKDQVEEDESEESGDDESSSEEDMKGKVEFDEFDINKDMW